MSDDLTSIDGVGPTIAENLRQAGFESVADVENATVEALSEVHLIGPESARAILEGDSAAHGGRPDKFTDDRVKDAIEAAKDGFSKAGCARAAGVVPSTLNNWLNANPDYGDGEFLEAFTRARHQGEKQLVTEPLYTEDADGPTNRPEMDGQHARFLLSTSFDYKKTEKQEVEHSGGLDNTTELGEESTKAIREALADRYE